MVRDPGLDTLELLASLVRAGSENPPGGEAAVAEVIEHAAARLGLGSPVRLGRTASRPNVLLDLGGEGPALLLVAHMDTVPAGDLAAWRSPPDELRVEGDVCFGLGVADMKGAITAMLVGAARVGSGCRARTLLLFVADEEDRSAFGMEWLAAHGHLQGDAALIFEPASVSERSWDGLYVAQRGSCVVRVAATGVPGHSGLPLRSGRRAGDALVSALSAIADASVFNGRHEVDGTPAIVNAPSMLGGGTSPWVHPARLDAHIEIRTVPGMTPAAVEDALEATLADADLGAWVRCEVESWAEPSATLRDARLLQACENALGATLARVPPRAVFPATTDSIFLEAAGIPTIPAIGPGTLAACHQPNEYLDVRDLQLGVRLVEALIAAFAD